MPTEDQTLRVLRKVAQMAIIRSFPASRILIQDMLARCSGVRMIVIDNNTILTGATKEINHENYSITFSFQREQGGCLLPLRFVVSSQVRAKPC